MSTPSTVSVDDALRQAVAHQQASRFAQAEQLYRLILKHHPAHPDANHNLGLIAIAAHRPQDAVPLFRAALEAAPAHPQFWVSLCLGLLETGAADEARRLVAQAELQGMGGAAFDAVKQRLAQARVSDVLTASLQNMVASGSLPMPEAPRNRAQRRADGRKSRRRQAR